MPVPPEVRGVNVIFLGVLDLPFYLRVTKTQRLIPVLGLIPSRTALGGSHWFLTCSHFRDLVVEAKDKSLAQRCMARA